MITEKYYEIIKLELKVKDKNLVKANYINYKEKNSSILDYFGGIVQFLPFLTIINGLYRNKNIQYINKIDKESFLIDFSKDILKIIIKGINISKKKNQQHIQKYFILLICSLKI